MLGLGPILAKLADPPTTTLGKFSFLVGHVSQTHKLTAMVRRSLLSRSFPRRRENSSAPLSFDSGRLLHPRLPHHRSDHQEEPQEQEGTRLHEVYSGDLRRSLRHDLFVHLFFASFDTRLEP